MANQTIYTVGGTVQAGGGVYIPRKADDELLGYCRASEFAFILSSRQVGKSSLMVRTARQLESENIRSVIIDLSGIGVKISAEQWYLGILNVITKTLKLKTDIFAWWSESAGLGPAQQMTNFFSDVLLKEVSQPVVLFFDEIDSTLSIPFADDFFAALRAVYNARSTTPEFKRLSFVMIGVATPSDLIADDKRTPFNIGYRVDLTDFTAEEARPLAGHLGARTLEWIFRWTGGHPYLTQRLCAHLSKDETKITEESVAGAVKQLFEGEQGWQDNNLQFVRDMLTKRSPNLSRVLKTYKDIRTGKKVIDDERSIAKAHLKISGVVRSENGFLQPRNQIYKNVFNASWVQENTPKNWAKTASIVFGLLSFVLLSVFIFDFAVGVASSQYAGNFYTSRIGSEKLKNLAGLFELEGILQNTDYDFRARELFYSLNWNEQIGLFTDARIEEDKQYLPVIVSGLYVTMANIDGQQDSTELLGIMKKSLKDAKTSESMNLQNEIGLWLEARSASTDQESLSKYNEVIQLNANNPATYYERSRVEFRLGQYEQAIIDLDTTMRLAQNLSPETSEKEIATPTPWYTKTPILHTSTSVVATPHQSTQTSPLQTSTLVLETPYLSIQTPEFSIKPISPTNTDVVTESLIVPTQTPLMQATYSVREGYKSSFYSIAYIRSAVGLVMQEYASLPDFGAALFNSYSKIPNLKNAGLIVSNNSIVDVEETAAVYHAETVQAYSNANPMAAIEYLVRGTSFVQTVAANNPTVYTQYLATGTAMAEQRVLGQPVIDYFVTGTAIFSQVCLPGDVYWSRSYSVQFEDTLYSIANNHDTTVALLKRVNCLTVDYISVNQQLWVPNIATHTPTTTVQPISNSLTSTPTFSYADTDVYVVSNISGKREIYHAFENFRQITNADLQGENWSPVSDISGNLYFVSDRDGKAEIYMLNANGQRIQITLTPGQAESWSPVPDGNGNLYFTSNRDGKAEIYVLNANGQIIQITVTPEQAESWSPAPDGNGNLYFVSNRDGKAEIYVLNANGKTIQFTVTPGQSESWSPAPNGNGILYFTSDRSGKAEIFALDVNGQIIQITVTPGQAESWSPVLDGNGNLYFTSDRSGKREVFIMTEDGAYTIRGMNSAEIWTGTIDAQDLGK